MAEEKPAPSEEPAEAPVLRLAENLLKSELPDYMVIMRHRDGTFDFVTSNLTWAIGAVSRVEGMLDAIVTGQEDRE